jgi:hypothetical protein
MHHLIAKRKVTPSSGQKRPNSSLATSFPGVSEQLSREMKSAPYQNPDYPKLLSKLVPSYIKDHALGISDASKVLLDKLLHTEQSTPKDTIFNGEGFDKHFPKLEGKNEARIIQDLSPLLVPSAEAFASLGATHLDGVVESVNEGWNNCYPITPSRPQPDSAFGYREEAFSEDQFQKLEPTLGGYSSLSYFKATSYMHFPFLIKEVKRGEIGLAIADKQNLHSATIAVRAAVELFKLVGRETELHREIVAFTISHDNNGVKLYAHYPFIDGDSVTIWRHTVSRYFLDSETKWKTWTFTKNVFDTFSTMHLERICSAVDSITPEMLESQNPTLKSLGLSHQLEFQRIDEEETNSPDDHQSTSNTPIQTTMGSPKGKKIRKT